MAQKQSILGRIAQLARANVNALIDQAEDPEKVLDQVIRDYTANISDAEAAIAQTIGNLRLAEADRDDDVAAVREWGGKALAASRKADELRAAGRGAEADRFDELAKLALKRQISFEQEVSAATPQIAAQTEVVDKLKSGLAAMKEKLTELRGKRDQLVARAKAAQAQSQVQAAIGSIDVLDPTSELSRFEERVRREEARVAGQAELQADSLDARFAELEDLSADLDVEARLAALKSGA
ncbi:PspA/IM30 family protein [Paenibacillus sp. TRM 82003]|uniref:PspA/IM30 family protein n=1 Tax=Kineococcus sp. TRM81007 TaxID=2925831 RepID=UPI001F5A505D|nr:PspA/IM30 family protein [Kineococcus sp. TRM81007]MCI2237344.1 PspA/IM30 family protein [Kineococcus sp. TRM81007]MCI3926549.1 PspA/IM30 family protein [Paenibacillus sp. TRM 82003]